MPGETRRVTAAPRRVQRAALSLTRASGTWLSTSLQPKNIGVPARSPVSGHDVPGGPMTPPL